MAAVKHKKKIIQTVKMLYVGQELPCFEAGDAAIQNLQHRLNSASYDHCQR